MALLRDTARRLGRTRLFAAVGRRIAPPIDLAVSRLTGGRRTFAGLLLPTLVLVHRGSRSGREYRTPVSYVADGDRFYLAATNWGQRSHPAWSANLMANPGAEVVVDGEVVPVRARRLSEEEKEEVWPRFVEMWPAYASYRSRTSRNVRLFVLERR
jgi:deazaflavin-dependent oxidoreductase (nitroreductase family)